MKRQIYIMSLLAFILFLGPLNWSACKAKKEISSPAPLPTKEESNLTTKPKEPPFMMAIREKIKGKENLPAEEVFENIQILKGMPAKRVLPIMKMAFSRSLGVKCTHCHEFNNWASENKKTKQIARNMWVMARKINTELLPGISNLQGPQPVANCTTCHRGEIIPATSLPGKK